MGDVNSNPLYKPEFAMQATTPESAASCEQVAQMFSDLLDRLDAVLPAGRERALVVTKLQEAAHWAHAALTLPIRKED